jgi:hypothetical protein
MKQQPAVTTKPWKHSTVESFQVPETTSTWQTQLSVTPDGSNVVGLRKFITKKASTDLIATNMGLSIPVDDVAPRLLRKLSKMLANLADHV